jgi:hypothetical protein
MEFNNADVVSSVCWMLKQADYYRGLNRARINDLFNGVPPYSEDEVQDNNIAVNCNFLESTRLGHDARSQFTNAYQKPGKFFTAKTDMGPVHKRDKWGVIVSNAINRRMKKSLKYMEKLRSSFALDILHGIGPGTWEDGHKWCPDPRGVEDLLIPANTYLHFENLPFFAIMRSYTAPELIRLTHGPHVDKGWDMEVVNGAIAYIDKETTALYGSNYPEVWSPEKIHERIKGDGTYYSGDAVPTIDTFDFYYWSDQEKEEGWRRRIIFDDWGGSMQGSEVKWSRNNDLSFGKGKFLYNGGAKSFADRREHLFQCQFADLSAVAPFRYHSVRSLGFLLYGICHLQNRLRCKMQEATFETLMQLFRVKSMDDIQKALNIQLYNHSFIDETINPIPAQDRWQPNVQLAELGLRENAGLISQNAASYTQQQNFSEGRTEKTKFQVMAEMNSMQAMVSAALNQSYEYQNHEYREIFRRFLIPDSKDPDVREARAEMLRMKVPEKVLVPEAWDIESERIMGGGNKTLEMTIAQQLMEWREKFDPDPQRIILRDAVLAITDDPGRAEELVPESPRTSDSVHDTEAVFGTLMTGTPVDPRDGLNAVEVAGKTIQMMAHKVQQIEQSGGMGTPADLLGLLTAEQYAKAYIDQLAKDPTNKAIVKTLGDNLGKVMNQVKAFGQRQQEAAQQSQQNGNGGGGLDPKDAAKINAMMLAARTKAENAKQSHAQKTAQRQIQFEQEMRQRAEEHDLQMQQDHREHAANLQKTALEADEAVRAARLRSTEE